MTEGLVVERVQYRVTGMDCGDCAAKIEAGVRKLDGVEDVRVSIASELMTLQVDEAKRRLPEVERSVRALGYHLERVDTGAAEGTEAPDAVRRDPSYRRALWIVVLLNVGYGVVEIGAGLAGRSQALQADALDFFGDGLITCLGLWRSGGASHGAQAPPSSRVCSWPCSAPASCWARPIASWCSTTPAPRRWACSARSPWS